MLIEGQMPLLPTMSTDSFFNLVESLPSTTPTDAHDGGQLVSFVQPHGPSVSRVSLGETVVQICCADHWRADVTAARRKTVSGQWL
jgi:hypothetical protein